MTQSHHLAHSNASRDFPALYHAHHSQSTEDLDFWRQLAASHHGALLELGCGTGRILLPLLENGYDITGLDLDAAMLAYLHLITPAYLQTRLKLVQADMSAYHFNRQFGLIILPCNTISTLSRDARSAALQCVAQHLAAGGYFAASLPNPTQLKHLPRRGPAEFEETFPHPEDGEPVQVSSAWQRDNHALHLEWIYDHLLPDGRVERVTATAHHSLDSAEVYYTQFKQAGLQVVETFGDFDHSQYHLESPNLILIARKPPG